MSISAKWSLDVAQTHLEMAVFKLMDDWGGRCTHKGLFEAMRPDIFGLVLIIHSIIVGSELKMHKTSHEMEIKRLLYC